jgi:hypothetical protein
MERNKRRPSGTTSSEDTVFVQFTTKGLPPDSPEFQERARRPLSERGPNLARYRELLREQREDGEQPAQ